METDNASGSSSSSKEVSVTFLVVGGGIAGVSCAEILAVSCEKNERIMLLTESNVVKTIANLEPVARYLHKFDVRERSVAELGNDLLPSIITVVDRLKRIDATERKAYTHGNRIISYHSLCLSTGAAPHLIDSTNPRVLGIRDTDSVLEFQRRLHTARRIVLVGNGGIATELAHELQGVEVHWVVKDNHIASTFVDPGAAHFFMEDRNKKLREAKETKSETTDEDPTAGVVKRLRYEEFQPAKADEGSKRGAALGPDWHRKFELSGRLENSLNPLVMHYKAQIVNIEEDDNKSLKVKLTTGDMIECDFVVSATGVEPRHDYVCSTPFVLTDDKGIAVNEMMETNVGGIYAAGDCCTATWKPADHWFQMRLWTQARHMGGMAGRSMLAALRNEQIHQDFCFEIFGHVTKLFGFQVVLLGRFNGQGLGTDYEILLRSTPSKEYIKFVIQQGRLRGAILIGNTELAETCENLILNGIDLTPYGDDILNPDIDIEDYFD